MIWHTSCVPVKQTAMGAEGDSELKLFNPVQFRKMFGRIELCTEPICSKWIKARYWMDLGGNTGLGRPEATQEA